jgi:hypothetical protein
LMMV